MGRPSALSRIRRAPGRRGGARNRRDVQRKPQAGADRRHRDSSLQGLARAGRAGRADGRAGADHGARQGRLPDGPSAVHGRPRRADKPAADRRADGRGGLRAESRLPQDRHELRQSAAAYHPGQVGMGGRSARRRQVPHLHERRRARFRARAAQAEHRSATTRPFTTPTTCATAIGGPTAAARR